MRRWRMPTPGHIAFRADGAQMAILQKDPRNSTCRIVDAESGRVLRSILLPNLPLVGVVWSPDGTTLATPSDDQKIYLWDAATGIRKATLEGHTNAGLSVAFHPTGALLASNGWERRLRLWDAALGRPVLSLSGDHYYFHAGFSQDGRIVVSVEDRLTTYMVEPALEYQTLAHAFGQPVRYWRASIRSDGRVLALGTDRGVVLWDLARARNSHSCRSDSPGTRCSRPRATCSRSPAATSAFSGGRFSSIPRRGNSASARRAGSRCQ